LGNAAHELLRLADGVRPAEPDEVEHFFHRRVEAVGRDGAVDEPELDRARGRDALAGQEEPHRLLDAELPDAEDGDHRRDDADERVGERIPALWLVERDPCRVATQLVANSGHYTWRILATTCFITSSAPPPMLTSRESTKARAAGFSQQ